MGQIGETILFAVLTGHHSQLSKQRLGAFEPNEGLGYPSHHLCAELKCSQSKFNERSAAECILSES